MSDNYRSFTIAGIPVQLLNESQMPGPKAECNFSMVCDNELLMQAILDDLGNLPRRRFYCQLSENKMATCARDQENMSPSQADIPFLTFAEAAEHLQGLEKTLRDENGRIYAEKFRWSGNIQGFSEGRRNAYAKSLEKERKNYYNNWQLN